MLEPGLIVLALLLLAAGAVALLRRNPRARPRVDRAIERYWDTEQHSDVWDEEERERREQDRRQ